MILINIYSVVELINNAIVKLANSWLRTLSNMLSFHKIYDCYNFFKLIKECLDLIGMKTDYGSKTDD